MQCLSALAPDCGHKPTADDPVCKPCRLAHERYLRDAEDKLIHNAKAVLVSRGYKITEPSK